jgi:CDP-diacylglycerol---serine O-phosphatidyltransferase
MVHLTKSIPSLLTLGNLLMGFAAILMADNPLWGMVLICAGALFDIIDGLAARALNAVSEFGKQLDSLADIVTFGVAPAVFIYHQVLPQSFSGAAIAALIPVCAAMRLAKFNTDESQSTVFKGLPSPAAGIFFAGLPVLVNEYMPGPTFIPLLLAVTAGVALLMISNLTMFSFKGMKSPGRNRIFPLILLAGGAIIIPLLGWKALPPIVVWYILLSVIFTFAKSHSQPSA